MIKITEYGTIKSAGNVRKRGSTSSVSFGDLLDAAEAGGVDSAGAPSDVAATAALSNLLALQEISDDVIERRKLVQQGNNLLDSLEQLRRDVLLGRIPASTLRQIGRELSVQKQQVADDGLMALIDDIELRAAVELAKLEKAAQLRGESPEK